MISFDKLERLLSSQGFSILRIYSIDNLCIFIETVSLINSILLLLYIPSKYKIDISSFETFPIKYISPKDDTNSFSSDDLLNTKKAHAEDIYQEIDLDLNIDNIEDKYKKDIDLSHNIDDDIIGQCFKQLTRYAYCTNSIAFKFSILYKNYILTTTRKNEIDCFEIINNEKLKMNLVVTIDLENFYKQIGTNINKSIKKLKYTFMKILDKNYIFLHNQSTKLINKINLTRIQNKKNEYTRTIIEYEKSLDKITENEKVLYQKINQINQIGSATKKTYYGDMENEKNIGNIENEIDKTSYQKQTIINNMLSTIEKLDDLYLKTDRIYFDNLVMINTIMSNCNSLNNML